MKLKEISTNNISIRMSLRLTDKNPFENSFFFIKLLENPKVLHESKGKRIYQHHLYEMFDHEQLVMYQHGHILFVHVVLWNHHIK